MITNDNYILLEFDGAFCYLPRVPSGDKTRIDSLLKRELRYEDKSLSYLAYRNNWSVDSVKIIYDENKSRFPTGLVCRVYRLLEQAGYVVEVKSLVTAPKRVDLDLPDWLYEHQIKAIKTLLNNPRAVAQMPTGSGY